MPRLTSFVTGLASAGFSTGAAQTVMTPLTGARELSFVAPGRREAAVLSALPDRHPPWVRAGFLPGSQTGLCIENMRKMPQTGQPQHLLAQRGRNLMQKAVAPRVCGRFFLAKRITVALP